MNSPTDSWTLAEAEALNRLPKDARVRRSLQAKDARREDIAKRPTPTEEEIFVWRQIVGRGGQHA